MTTYYVEVYELHAQKYAVDAENRVDALRRHALGESDPIVNDLEYLETADAYGRPVLSDDELEEAAEFLHVSKDKTIPGIRSIEEI